MKKEKMYAILCYIASMCLYLIGFLGGIDRNDISLFCLGSAMLCFGSVFLNKANKNDEDK